MSGLTREETANPVFKGENRRPERGREKQRNKHIFSFQLTTSRGIENYAGLKHNLLDMVSHYKNKYMFSSPDWIISLFRCCLWCGFVSSILGRMVLLWFP